MTTAFVTHPRYVEHDQKGHPEHAGRIRAVLRRLEEAGLMAQMQQQDATPAAEEQIRLVHTAAYYQLVMSTAAMDRWNRLDADTYVGPMSADVALLSAGGVVDAVAAVLEGKADNALAAVRPPGHHAMPDRAMGFCIFNNVAVAARVAQEAYGLKRVMIVDYDVHHGNGTEAMFYDDPSVYFVSIHQWPLYPGTGAVTDIGRGAGRGATLNIPVEPGNGDANYAAMFEQVLWPAAERFQPELILVSVGHDAHWSDPLAGMKLTLTGYAHLAREMKRMADKLCSGRVVFVMEGGYDLDALSYGMVNIAHVLLEDGDSIDPMGPVPGGNVEPDIAPLIAQVRKVHGL
jgi:acetoin utilization deacetylase AcuC-like enzyme